MGDIAPGVFLEGQGAKTSTKNPPRERFVEEFGKPCFEGSDHCKFVTRYLNQAKSHQTWHEITK